MIKVSIIVPIYNSASYLGDCLDSILAQTHDNLEIILINDGSTDASGSICDDYARKDTRIIVIHQVNSGVSAARNRGIEILTGKYAMFVDSDDAMHPFMVDNLLTLAMRNQADMVTCRSTNHPARLRPVDMRRKYENVSQKDAMLALLCPSNMDNAPFAKLIAVKHLHGLKFNTSLTIAEDLEFNYRLIKTMTRVTIIDTPLYHYRKVQGGATLSSFKPKRMDGLSATGLVLKNISIGGDHDLLLAAQTRHFMEAVYISTQILNSKHYKIQQKECETVMCDLKHIVANNLNAISSHRNVAKLAIINTKLSIRYYKLRGKIGKKINEMIKL